MSTTVSPPIYVTRLKNSLVWDVIFDFGDGGKYSIPSGEALDLDGGGYLIPSQDSMSSLKCTISVTHPNPQTRDSFTDAEYLKDGDILISSCTDQSQEGKPPHCIQKTFQKGVSAVALEARYKSDPDGVIVVGTDDIKSS